MKSKPNIDAFLEGAAERRPKRAASTKTGIPADIPAAEFKKQVVMQLPLTIINDLKRRALELSVSSGKRITQQQLVAEAIKNYLYR